MFAKEAVKSVNGLHFHCLFYPFLWSTQNLKEAKGKEVFPWIIYKLGHQLLGLLIADLFKTCPPNIFARSPLGNSEYSGHLMGSHLLK